KHEHSEALIGSIMYQLINDPMRATSLLAALNSNSRTIDEALYLQEETAATTEPAQEPADEVNEEPVLNTKDDLGDVTLDSLADFSSDESAVEEEASEEDNPLDDFFSRMNQ